MTTKFKVGVGVALTLGVLMIVAAINPFVTIQAGEKGLVKNFGALEEITLAEGLHTIIPVYQKVQVVDVTVQNLNYVIPVGGDGALTSDNQTIGADTALFYRWDEARLVETVRAEGFASVRTRLQSALKQAFKESIGAYTIFEVATKQEEIREAVFASFSTLVTDYPVHITELRIQNYAWSDRFDQQIQKTMDRAQQVKEAEQDLLLTEQQAQKDVKKAEAAKQALVLKAEGEKEAAALRAEAKALEGEGVRQYNTSVQANMVLELQLRQLEIDKVRAEAWDGKMVPNNMYGPIPFNSVGGVQGN